MSANASVVTRWPEFDSSISCLHGFIGRVPGVDVVADRETAMQRLRPRHREILRDHEVDPDELATAEQVHGAAVAVVHGPVHHPGVDALVTNRVNQPLGIYVADCAAVYLIDPVRRVIGLAHSGKKGSEGGISITTVDVMHDTFGCHPEDMIACISPCIRPPHYEVDFAAMIRDQLDACKVRRVIDTGVCTAENLDRYYSYRMERGQTGRMLAFLTLRE